MIMADDNHTSRKLICSAAVSISLSKNGSAKEAIILSSHSGKIFKHHGSPQRVQKFAGTHAIKGIDDKVIIAIDLNAFMVSPSANISQDITGSYHEKASCTLCKIIHKIPNYPILFFLGLPIGLSSFKLASHLLTVLTSYS